MFRLSSEDRDALTRLNLPVRFLLDLPNEEVFDIVYAELYRIYDDLSDGEAEILSAFRKAHRELDGDDEGYEELLEIRDEAIEKLEAGYCEEAWNLRQDAINSFLKTNKIKPRKPEYRGIALSDLAKPVSWLESDFNVDVTTKNKKLAQKKLMAIRDLISDRPDIPEDLLIGDVYEYIKRR